WISTPAFAGAARGKSRHWPSWLLDLQHLLGADRFEFVHHQFAVCGESNGKVRERPRRGPGHLRPVLLKLAPVAGALDEMIFGLPLRDAAEVRADRRDRIEAGLRPHDVHLLVL